MRCKLALFAILLILFLTDGQTQNQAHVCVRHLTSPTRYPAVARQARIQGTVTASLRISADGVVNEVLVVAQDPILVAHPILQSETQRTLRQWTFDCQSCASGNSFEHMIKFTYRLEGDDAPYDDTRVIMNLPDEVTIIARPPVCDHCPPLQKKR
jgi:TonB family protein